MTDVSDLPTWAPRVSQTAIRRLYETDAEGIYDEALINEVGYALLTRCESFIAACLARAGRVHCPRCKSAIDHKGRKDEVLNCACGWRLTWGEYFKTIQHNQLSGAEPVLEQFRDFAQKFAAARQPRAKMLAIDRLIHGFHYSHKTLTTTRPVAVNLIEGPLRKVVAFLDQLTYSQQSSHGLAATHTEWQRHNEGMDWYFPAKDKKDPADG